ncbi:MAG: L,D-transpeptidase family protein [Deltaproteobacteria bacterium]
MFLLHIVLPGLAGSTPLPEQVREILRNRVEASKGGQKITCKGELICGSNYLRRFYENRLFSPAWSDHHGPLTLTDIFVRRLEDAGTDGLRGGDYHLNAIISVLDGLRGVRANEGLFDPAELADLDLLLTDAFLLFSSHLLSGRVDPERIRAEWHVKGRKADMAAILESAIDSGQIDGALDSLSPPYPGYARLRNALSFYRALQGWGVWQRIPDKGKMQRGDADSRIAALRNRLMTLGDLDLKGNGEADVFDGNVENAVKKFQSRHGLTPDGVVGPATLGELNVRPEERIRQIEVNMERWRWLPETMGDRHIFVNVASFELGVVEGRDPVMTMRAIVGKHYQRTPVFSAQMTHLVLNPYWNVPVRIATKEMLPLIQKDLDYLEKNSIKVFLVQGSQKTEVDPSTVDWASVSPTEFNYFFRQEAGPKNSLGRIKFMFPNKFNVYLHDTPHKELFERPVRQFSHGCIRIEKPLELAEFLLRGDPRWTQEELLRALDGSVDRTVKLPRPIGIHILYWTAWVDEDGTVQFRNDVYGRDMFVARALEEAPPGP